ncbi:energy transducer TonB [Hymenobacter sp. BRD128]|uniref:energy transducer TonB n=1 Tax=Hymenobacter sp. BRD128 TaxID=2675878 RepID=UPI001564BB6D|nr:energy transducer TonB [Hymenobacter sp. BRD128]QKG57473.1 energy transducer TonB [Hymenobacter sp. BRD128]
MHLPICFVLTTGLLISGHAALAQAERVVNKFEHGTRTNSQPTGSWEYFEEAGQLALRMNYDSSRISYRRPDTARYELRIGDTWQLVHPTRPPGLLGSRAGRREALQKALRYPIDALQQQKQGDVLLSYVVQPNGHTTDYTVVSSPLPACTQEVWRVFNQLPDHWIPAIYQGQARAARFYLLVHFSMKLARSAADLAPALPNHASSGPFTDVVEVTAVGVERSGRR